VRVKSKSKFDRLLVGTSAIAMAVASAIAVAQENAQKAENATTAPKADEDSGDVATIVVTGIRAALETAAETKRRADTFVDSVTASDVTSLPDLSVAEALQRIPGVTVSRFPTGGGASPDFPSPEGRGNLIRGLGFIRSEFNGRDAFSANGGRALDWSSIPPELVGGIDVYKNQSADLIEGGIGGTINLRTLEPFDRSGHILAFSADGTYGDLGEKWSPTYAAVLGNRWDTDAAGEFGVLASYSRSKLRSKINGWQQGAPTPRTIVTQAEFPNDFEKSHAYDGLTADDIQAYVPGFQLRTNDVDRDRTSYYLALQWQKESFRTTVKYAKVKNSIDSLEHTTEWFPNHAGGNQFTVSDLTMNPDWETPGIALCNGDGGRINGTATDLDGDGQNPGDCETIVPARGLMESGLVSSPIDAWTGAQGLGVGTLGVGKHENATTEDISLNMKWNATEKLFFELDAQLTKADADYVEVWGGGTFFSDVFVNPDLERPTVEFRINPLSGINRSNTRQGVPLADQDDEGNCIRNCRLPTPTSTADPNNAFWLFASDSFREGTGELKAFRFDTRYEFGEDSWFKAVRFGVRYSEREQLNKEIGGNWGGISPAWAGGYGVFSQMNEPAYELIDFKNFFRGGVVQGANTKFPYIRGDLLMNYSAMRQYLLNEPDIGTNHPWNPRGNLDGTGAYRPEDISDITEETQNAYVRFDFGHEIGSNGMSIDANVGVRFTKSDLTSNGFIAYDDFDADEQTPNAPNRTPTAEDQDHPRDFLPEATAYLQQAATPYVTDRSDTKMLPSINVKWNLNDNSLVRFGASKALTRPNIQDLRATRLVGASTTRTSFPNITDPNDPLFGVDRGAQDIDLGRITITRGNPDLKPTTAVNLDLSYEWYFQGGYFSAALFKKDLENIIVTGDQTIDTITLDGQTVDVVFNGPINQAEANLHGFELAYQQFFDKLPGWMSHLGVQANYTNIQAKADPPGTGVDANNDGVPEDVTQAFRFGVTDLLGQSEHIANVVGIYQDQNMEFRLAYNWRSQYLTTYRDWVSGNPIYASDIGLLDGSFRYDFNEHFQVSASISNILDTKEKAIMQLNDQGQTAPRFAFLNDRRMVLGMRYQF
jgi:iron complex outermembrane recepter protein